MAVCTKADFTTWKAVYESGTGESGFLDQYGKETGKKWRLTIDRKNPTSAVKYGTIAGSRSYSDVIKGWKAGYEIDWPYCSADKNYYKVEWPAKLEDLTPPVVPCKKADFTTGRKVYVSGDGYSGFLDRYGKETGKIWKLSIDRTNPTSAIKDSTIRGERTYSAAVRGWKDGYEIDWMYCSSDKYYYKVEWPAKLEEIERAIVGKVTDKLLGTPIVFAAVSFFLKTAVTGSDGKYKISYPELGSGTITASMTGYVSESKGITSPKEGTLTVDFALAQVAPPPPLPVPKTFWEKLRALVKGTPVEKYAVVESTFTDAYTTWTELPATFEKISDIGLKVLDWILPLNALSRLFTGKNLDGTSEEYHAVLDSVDIALSAVLFIPIAKLPAVVAKVGEKAGLTGLSALGGKAVEKGASKEALAIIAKETEKVAASTLGKLGTVEFMKLFATKIDDAVKLAKSLGVDDQIKLVTELVKTKDGLVVAQALITKEVFVGATKVAVHRATAIAMTNLILGKVPAKIPTWVKIAVGVGTVTLMFVAFQWSDFVFGLRKNKILPPYQIDLLQDATYKSVAVIDTLENIKFSCSAEGYRIALEDIDKINKVWDEAIDYARKNPMADAEWKNALDSLAAYVGIGAYPTAESMAAAIVDGKKLFNDKIAVEKTSIAKNCPALEVVVPVVPLPEGIRTYVRNIVDGDTIDVSSIAYDNITGSEIKLPVYGTIPHARVRIVGINAPEKTPKGEILCTDIEIYGVEKKYADLSRDALLPINDKEVVLMTDPDNLMDAYGRIMAKVTLAGKDIGLDLIKRGLACWYFRRPHKYVDDELYKRETLKAKDERVGMWGEVTKGAEELVAKVGSIGVGSSPANARIFLDDEDTGLLTAETIKNVKVGTYTVKIELEGYEEYEKKVTVESGKKVEVYKKLVKITPDTGELRISSSPANAQIFLDDVDTGLRTTEVLKDVSTGLHKVTMKLEGHRQYDESVTVLKGKRLEVFKKLEKMPALTGDIKITTSPAGASIYLDGVDLKLVSSETIKDVAAGKHMVKLVLKNYTVFEAEVEVEAGKTIEVSQKWEKPIITTGMIRVYSLPTYANIWIDGVDTKKLATEAFELSPGTYVVEVRKSGYVSKSESITLAEGEYIEVRFELEQVPFMVVEFLPPEAPPPGVIVPKTLQEFFDVVKTFYADRMYMSKKELVALGEKYRIGIAGVAPLVSEEIQRLYAEMQTYYVGLQYMSKTELRTLGIRYGLSVAGLV